jgi:fumarylpyruvate hydrolase
MAYLFAPPSIPTVRVVGTDALFPVNRIFCVGRNYAEHAKEMGGEIDREAPFYFTKPSSAIVRSGSTVPYPPGTENYHYEMELVIAIGQKGFQISNDEAPDLVFGYAAGLDMTRRDLQLAARAKGRPWDLGKAFEQSAIMGTIAPINTFGPIGHQRIVLTVNGEIRQQAQLSELIWTVPSLVRDLSRFYHLEPGDLIYTGTPAGVGPVLPGDRLSGEIAGLPKVELTIGPAS